MKTLKRCVKSIFNTAGFELRRTSSSAGPQDKMPVELSIEEQEIVSYVIGNHLSMTSHERLWTTIMACKHAVSRNISGDFVECGVWRGGNAILAAALFKLYKSPKRVYLFDTYEGMTAPTDKDRQATDNTLAMGKYQENRKETHNEWCFASIEDVQENFKKAGLLDDSISFIKGDVLQTLSIEENLPQEVSVLRLDTDWYESTKKELEILYPKLSIGGALIIDDYGHWAGAKQATDEYFSIHGKRPFLQYTDYTGRVGVKFD